MKAMARVFLRFTERLLLAIGLLALGWCGFVFLKGSLYQRWGREALSQRAEGSAEGDVVDGVRLPPVRLPLAQRSLVGSMEIPRIGLTAVV